MGVISNIFKNRKLVASLAINDFKTKYSGSQFGILWAFVQPVITVMIYVFVFQVIAKAAPLSNGFPFVLWLIAGMVPWFFFSEAVMNGANCLIDYSYLVKKVVFNIQILPVVRVVSSVFVHLFFVCVTIIIYICNGVKPTFFYFQIFYYMISALILSAAISYITSSIMPFFRDFLQLLNIILMVGMWVCPVMWDYAALVPEKYQWLLRLNPIFYIIQGYRDSFIDHIWFWNRPIAFLCFWSEVLIILVIGNAMFKKLSVHFADVL